MLLRLAALLVFGSSRALGQCLEHDSKPPKCEEWIGVEGEPVFIEHVFNCSRFWVCQPDLSDCLHECAKADENSALFFDVRYQYPIGPVCDWPANIDCTNKPEECGQCEVWQECVDTGNGYICIPDCKIDPHCDDDEYCDLPDGGDGNCQKGCRDNSVCGNNVVPCGECINHVCQEPDCCTDADCPGNEICVNGSCEFECITDDDCKPDEYCSNGECLLGCNENEDCTNTSCSTCGSNHECIDPECCIDEDCQESQICSSNSCIEGCRHDSDCSMNGICAECGADNQCTTPECCSDEECPDNQICSSNSCVVGCRDDSDCSMNGVCAICGANNQCTTPECCSDDDCDASNPVCSDDFNCIPGCRKDENCPGYDALCNQDYSNCNYCNITNNADYGNCSPGCVEDVNCDGNQVCNGYHMCSDAGSTKNLRQIVFKTAKCKGCQDTNVEAGPVLHLNGGESMAGATECDTLALDHPNTIDYQDGMEAIFADDKDKDVLGTCYRANLQGEITGGKITWTASQGEWSLEGNQIDFTWSDPLDCKFTCCLEKDTLSPSNRNSNLIKCKKNCQDNVVC